MEDLEQLKVLEHGYKMKVGGGRVEHDMRLGLGVKPECPAAARCRALRRRGCVPGWPEGGEGKRSRSIPPTRARQVVVVSHSSHGVDLPEDVASIERLIQAQESALQAAAGVTSS